MNVSSMLVELRAERDRLDQAISALEGISGRGGATARRAGAQAGAGRGGRRRRNLSPAARKRISDAQKKRWAAVRKAKAAAA